MENNTRARKSMVQSAEILVKEEETKYNDMATDEKNMATL
jgi:hypothetical protein